MSKGHNLRGSQAHPWLTFQNPAQSRRALEVGKWGTPHLQHLPPSPEYLSPDLPSKDLQTGLVHHPGKSRSGQVLALRFSALVSLHKASPGFPRPVAGQAQGQVHPSENHPPRLSFVDIVASRSLLGHDPFGILHGLSSASLPKERTEAQRGGATSTRSHSATVGSLCAHTTLRTLCPLTSVSAVKLRLST